MNKDDCCLNGRDIIFSRNRGYLRWDGSYLKKGLFGGNVSTALYFDIPVIDSQMSTKIRFPEGVHSLESKQKKKTNFAHSNNMKKLFV